MIKARKEPRKENPSCKVTLRESKPPYHLPTTNYRNLVEDLDSLPKLAKKLHESFLL